MARPELERLWNDPGHWSPFGYRCPSDPRVIVPKRLRALGWTINWAHPRAIPMLLFMLGIAVGPALVVVAVTLIFAQAPGGLSPLGSALAFFGPMAAIGASTVVIIVLSLRLSRGE